MSSSTNSLDLESGPNHLATRTTNSVLDSLPLLAPTAEASSNSQYATDNHNRLDSIHLSSDASGETSMVFNAADFSAHSFIDSGEGATEIRNARNPPWSHGVTGTPIIHLALGDHCDASTFAERAVDHLPLVREASAASSHESCEPRNASQDQSLTPRPSVMTVTSQDALPTVRQTEFHTTIFQTTDHSQSAQPSPLYVSSVSPQGHAPSPFDSHHLKQTVLSVKNHNSLSVRAGAPARANYTTFHASTAASPRSGNVEAGAGLRSPMNSITSQLSTTRIASIGSGSGEASSEEEEAWPMPATPFISNENWPQDGEVAVKLPAPAGTAASLQPAKKVAPRHTPNTATASLPTKLSPSAVTTPHGRMHIVGGGRAPPRGLISHNGAKEGQRRVGRCKMYNCDKGVGFLIDDDLEEVPYDVKIHWTDLYSDQEFKSLAKGEVVEYTLNITSNGYSASYVTGPGGRPVMGAEFTIVQASRQTSYKLFKAGALPVKTYRSKWDGVPSPAGFLESPEVLVGGGQQRAEALSPITPGNIGPVPNTSTTPASSVPGLRANTIKVKLPGVAKAQVLKTVPLSAGKPFHSAATPKLSQPSPRAPLSVQNEEGSPWSHNGSPHNFTVGGMYRHLGHPALVRPAQAVSPNPTMAPFEALLLSGYAGQPMMSPATQFIPQGMHHASALPYNMHTLLAERHLLLQQQAALVALYQKSAVRGLTQATPTVGPRSHASALLPPIALSANHSPSPGLTRNDTEGWKGGLSLRPNAQAFSPAFEPSVIPAAISAQSPESRLDPHVYQAPGRRTVSDPKPSSLINSKRSSLGVKPSELPVAPRGYKRVTFAEEPSRARRVVSYGEVVDEEERINQRATSVEIAMERLREAAAPRRLSGLTHTYPVALGEDSTWMLANAENGLKQQAISS